MKNLISNVLRRLGFDYDGDPNSGWEDRKEEKWSPAPKQEDETHVDDRFMSVTLVEGDSGQIEIGFVEGYGISVSESTLDKYVSHLREIEKPIKRTNKQYQDLDAMRASLHDQLVGEAKRSVSAWDRLNLSENVELLDEIRDAINDFVDDILAGDSPHEGSQKESKMTRDEAWSKFESEYKTADPLAEGMTYVTMDGDDVGKEVEDSLMENETDTAKELSESILHAHELLKSEAEKVGGERVFTGGDNAFFIIPQEAAPKFSEIARTIYKTETGHTITVGIGSQPIEAHKALVYGKNTGKDKVVEYNEEVEEESAKIKQKQEELEETYNQLKYKASFQREADEVAKEDTAQRLLEVHRWVIRYQVEVDDHGSIVLYYATPKTNAATVAQSGLPKGTLLETTAEAALFFTCDNEDVSRTDVVLYAVHVPPFVLEPGKFGTLLDDLDATFITPVELPTQEEFKQDVRKEENLQMNKDASAFSLSNTDDPRVTYDPGAIPGEPSYYIDIPANGSPDDAKAAVVENDNPIGQSTWSVYDDGGQNLGEFDTAEEAIKSAKGEPELVAASMGSRWLKRADELDEETLKADLAASMSIEPDGITVKETDDDGGTFDAAGGEWRFYWTEDQAEQAAKDRVREDLENEPEIFNQDWLLDLIDKEKAKNFFEQVYNEWNASYANDIMSESSSKGLANRLVDELVEWNIVDEETAQAEDFDPEDHIDDFVEKMTQDQIDEGSGGYEHYKSNFGEEEAKKILTEHNWIDIDAAVEEAISTDGWPHFLSHYDGNYETTEKGVVYFREN